MGLVVLVIPDAPAPEVLVLGAGFSRALSDMMPLTDSLGDLAAASDDLAGDARLRGHTSFTNGNFETWLSRLAEDQPDLLTEENYENRAMFHRLSRAIHRVLSARQETVLGKPQPSWLPTLLSTLHVRRPTVITFNYDCLLEYGVIAHDLFHFGYGEYEGRTDWHDIIDEQPPLPPHPPRLSGSKIPTFRLLKLHGSLNWYWTPDDTTGATLNRWDLLGSWGSHQQEDVSERRRRLPGREPFLVPPAATKSAYYRNPIARGMWQEAHRALVAAKTVFLLGYSLPATDLVVTGMLADTCSQNTDVEIVNIDPVPVVNRLRNVGVPESSVRIHEPGGGAIPAFVERYCGQATTDLRVALSVRLTSDHQHEEPMMVATSRQAAAAIVDITANGDQIELRAEPATSFDAATARRDDGRPIPKTLSDLQPFLQSAQRLVAVSARGQRLDVIATESAATSSGYRDKWQVLTPAGVLRNES